MEEKCAIADQIRAKSDDCLCYIKHTKLGPKLKYCKHHADDPSEARLASLGISCHCMEADDGSRRVHWCEIPVSQKVCEDYRKLRLEMGYDERLEGVILDRSWEHPSDDESENSHTYAELTDTCKVLENENNPSTFTPIIDGVYRPINVHETPSYSVNSYKNYVSPNIVNDTEMFTVDLEKQFHDESDQSSSIKIEKRSVVNNHPKRNKRFMDLVTNTLTVLLCVFTGLLCSFTIAVIVLGSVRVITSKPFCGADAQLIRAHEKDVYMNYNNLFIFKGVLHLPRIEVRSGNKTISLQDLELDNDIRTFEEDSSGGEIKFYLPNFTNPIISEFNETANVGIANDTTQKPYVKTRVTRTLDLERTESQESYYSRFTGQQEPRVNMYSFNYINYKDKILSIGHQSPYEYLTNNVQFLESQNISSDPEDYILTEYNAHYYEHFLARQVNRKTIKPRKLHHKSHSYSRDKRCATEPNSEKFLAITRNKPLTYKLVNKVIRVKRSFNPGSSASLVSEYDDDTPTVDYIQMQQQKDTKSTIERLTNSADREAIKSRNDRHYLLSFDCTIPKKVPQPVSSFVDSACELNTPSLSDIDNPGAQSIFQILQKEDDRREPGHRCMLTVTRTISQCGAFDHSTRLQSEDRYNLPTPIPIIQCRKLAKENVYIDSAGKVHKVNVGETKYIRFYKAGSESFTENDNDHIECSGGEIKVNNKKYQGMIEHIALRVTLTKDVIIQRKDNSLVSLSDNVRLPCDLSDQGCISGTRTYIWGKPKEDYCSLVKTREVAGQVITANRGTDKIFMSNDQSGIRLPLGPETVLCAKTVYSTNFPEIYVFNTFTPKGKPKPYVFVRKIDKLSLSSIKQHLYITNRADFFYHHINSKLRKEFAFTKIKDCKLRLKFTKLEHFMARIEPSFHSYSFGGNTFLTTSGEVTYTYTCQPMLVQAITTNHCFDALPVSILKRDANQKLNFTDADRRPGSTRHRTVTSTDKEPWPTHYLEPLTHKILTIASVQPCTSGLYAMYRDILGRWLEVTPHIVKVDQQPLERKVSTLAEIRYEPFNDPLYSTRGHGIYELQDLNDMHRHLEFPRLRDALIHRMTGQSAAITPGQYIDPGIIFPTEAMGAYGNWAGFIFGPFFAWMQKMGSYTAIILFCWYTAKFGFITWKITSSCLHFSTRYGCSYQLLYSMCPEVHHSRQVRKTYRENKKAYRSRIANFRKVSEEMGDFTGQIPLSSYDPRARAAYTADEYQMIPEDPTNVEILMGTLQYYYDLHHGYAPTIRDHHLAMMDNAPLVINDLVPELPPKQNKLSKSKSQPHIYPSVPPYESKSEIISIPRSVRSMHNRDLVEGLYATISRSNSKISTRI